MCEYCNFNGDTYSKQVLYDDEVVEIMLNDTPEMEVNEYNQQGDYYIRDTLSFSFKVNYCPMCGRDLRVGRMMWCKNNNCCYYDRKKDKCKRVGKCGDNKGKKGVCWMDRSEGEY